MRQRLKFAILLDLAFHSVFLPAQSALPATGGDAAGPGGSASYTAGQVACSYISGENISINEGVQQPFRVSTFTAMEAPALEDSISLSPNPAATYAAIRMGNTFISGLYHYQLCDAQGKILRADAIRSAETQVSVQDLPADAYFLSVFTNKGVKSFKIIKK